MRLFSILRMAFRSINRNKLRSFLTMLGIVIGVAAVIAMLAIGQGARNAINSQIASLGHQPAHDLPRRLQRQRGAVGGGHRLAPVRGRRRQPSRNSARRSCIPRPWRAPARRSRPAARTGERQSWARIPNYLKIRDWDLVEGGTCFQTRMSAARNKVCVLGQTVMNKYASAMVSTQSARSSGSKPAVHGHRHAHCQRPERPRPGPGRLRHRAVFNGAEKLTGNTYAGNLLASAVTTEAAEEARAEINQTLMDRRKRTAGRRVRLHDPHADRHQQRREPDGPDPPYPSWQASRSCRCLSAASAS